VAISFASNLSISDFLAHRIANTTAAAKRMMKAAASTIFPISFLFTVATVGDDVGMLLATVSSCALEVVGGRVGAPEGGCVDGEMLGVDEGDLDGDKDGVRVGFFVGVVDGA
jgi:hypothetical protein